jgi:hypothetical protein
VKRRCAVALKEEEPGQAWRKVYQDTNWDAWAAVMHCVGEGEGERMFDGVAGSRWSGMAAVLVTRKVMLSKMWMADLHGLTSILLVESRATGQWYGEMRV